MINFQHREIRARNYQLIFEKILAHFRGDTDKTWTWLTMKNPALGFITPLTMIRHGKAKKLEAYIDSQLKGYFP